MYQETEAIMLYGGLFIGIGALISFGCTRIRKRLFEYLRKKRK